MPQTINILGTAYDFILSNPSEDFELLDAQGYCNEYKRKIVIDNKYTSTPSNGEEEIALEVAKVKRHEIIHAYFAESGLREWNNNEDLVDWIAWHFPNLQKTFKEVGAI